MDITLVKFLVEELKEQGYNESGILSFEKENEKNRILEQLLEEGVTHLTYPTSEGDLTVHIEKGSTGQLSVRKVSQKDRRVGLSSFPILKSTDSFIDAATKEDLYFVVHNSPFSKHTFELNTSGVLLSEFDSIYKVPVEYEKNILSMIESGEDVTNFLEDRCEPIHQSVVAMIIGGDDDE
jgi:hypothetical protein